jgi:hypothetical protein
MAFSVMGKEILMTIKMKMPASQASQSVRDEFAHLRNTLQIDKNNLDDECMQHPMLYTELSEAHVLAVAERDTLKEALSLVDAQAAQKIRTAKTKTGEKFNETMLGDLVQMDPTHQEAHQRWAQAVTRAAYLGALVNAAEQRGKMLQQLGQLFNAGYFDRVVAGSGHKAVDSALATAGREGMRKARVNRE